MTEAGRLKAGVREQVRAGEREPSQHGAVGYREGCPCDRCRRGHAERIADLRRRRAALPPEAIPHGLVGYRDYRCRCLEKCRPANTAKRAEERAARRAA